MCRAACCNNDRLHRNVHAMQQSAYAPDPETESPTNQHKRTLTNMHTNYNEQRTGAVAT